MISALQQQILISFARQEMPADFVADPFEDAGHHATGPIRREAALQAWEGRDLTREWIGLQLERGRSPVAARAEVLRSLEIEGVDPAQVFVRDGLIEGVRECGALPALRASGIPIELIRRVYLTDGAEGLGAGAGSITESPAARMAHFVEATPELGLSAVTISIFDADAEPGIGDQVRSVLTSPVCSALTELVWYTRADVMRFGPGYVDPLAAMEEAGIGRHLRRVAISEYEDLGTRFAEFLDRAQNRGLVHVRLHSVGHDYGLVDALAHPAMSTVHSLSCGLSFGTDDHRVPREDFSHLQHLRSLGVHGPRELEWGEFSSTMECRALADRLPFGLRDLEVGQFYCLLSPEVLFVHPRLAGLQRLCISQPITFQDFEFDDHDGDEPPRYQDHAPFANLLAHLERERSGERSGLRVLSTCIDGREELEAFKDVVRNGFFENLMALELSCDNRGMKADALVAAVREVRQHLPDLALLRIRRYVHGEQGIRSSRPLSPGDTCIVQRADYQVADTIFDPLEEELATYPA